jgi:hypothetical protein
VRDVEHETKGGYIYALHCGQGHTHTVFPVCPMIYPRRQVRLATTRTSFEFREDGLV